jgi:hypothetical protein
MWKNSKKEKEMMNASIEILFNNLVATWALQNGIRPAEILDCITFFIANHLREEADEEDIRCFCHDMYCYLIEEINKKEDY